MLLLLRKLKDSLNRCILLTCSVEALSEPWFSEKDLDTQRVCDEIGASMFVVSLWVWDADKALAEYTQRLNTVKIHIDMFLERIRSHGQVSDDALRLWKDVSAIHGRKARAAGLMYADYVFLERILSLSDPLKFKDAFSRCGDCLLLKADICRLYSEELDTAVGLISQQLEAIRCEGLQRLIG
jgi:hypothetical protein